MAMKYILVLFLISACHGAMVNADLKGIQDTGAANLPALSFIMLTDCDNPSAILFLSDNNSGRSVPGATLFIFRTDSGYRILNRSSTADDGKGIIGVPGKLQFLNDLYVLRIEKPGYRSKEVQFTFWNCDDVKREYSEYSQPEPDPAANVTEAALASMPIEPTLMETPAEVPLAISKPAPDYPALAPESPPASCLGISVLAGIAFLSASIMKK